MVVARDDARVRRLREGPRPAGHDFRGKASIGKRHRREAARLEHAAHLPEHLERAREVVRRQAVRDDVEAIIFVR